MLDEFAIFTRLLGWRLRAEYHREASDGEHAFSSTVYVLKLEPEDAADEGSVLEQRRREGSSSG